ncbi:MAG TPA: methyl-accepting chemotaxis protein [Candidatus Acidoferrales bacterium]|nr:methyl-accepting chemotaxis protein [Candidatus Acidoferrales bacterium]
MQKKVLLGPAVAAAMTFLSLLAAYGGIRAQRVSLQSIYNERLPAMSSAATAEHAMAGVQADTYKLLTMMSSNFPQDKVDAEANNIRKQLDAVATDLRSASGAHGMSAEEKRRFESAANSVDEYHKVIDEVIDVAGVQVSMAAAFMSKAQNKYENLAVQLKALHEFEQRETNGAYKLAESVASLAGVVVITALILSVGFSVMLNLYIGSRIVGSTQSLKAVTARIAEGEIGDEVEAMLAGTSANLETDAKNRVASKNSDDEIGELVRLYSKMVRYLKEMARASATIAHGDLSAEIRPRSERDALGNAFIEMKQGLVALVGNVRNSAMEVANSSNQVARASEGAAKVSTQASAAIDDVSSTMQQMSVTAHGVVKNTQAQSESVSETSTAIEQMVASIQRVADNSKALIEISRRSRTEVQAGVSTLEKANKSLTRINTSIQSSAEVIDSLGQRANDIGKIVMVIEDLADQSNLLALNAAIEAARAGEHGLGFAVVADEVRKLAEKSAESTKEISALIEGIQREANSAVENMHKNIRFVDEGMTLSSDVSAALKRIDEVVSEVHRFSEEIGSAMIEQASGSQQMAQTTRRLNEITQEISSSVEEQSVGTQNVVKAMERMRDLVQTSASGALELAASAEQMSKMSRRLLESMGQFKVEGSSSTGAVGSQASFLEGRIFAHEERGSQRRLQ